MSTVQGELSKLGKHMDESGHHAGEFKKKIHEVGKEMLKAFVGVEAIKFLGESAKVAAENAVSFGEMARQLKTSTGATEAQSKAIDGQLEGLSESSGVLMTKLRPAYDTFIRATGDSTKAMRLQQIALNVSAATGKDLNTVTLAMARASTGNAAALNRLVPGVKNAKDQMAFLEKETKGAAKAAADKNPFATLQVVMEKIKVTLGNALLPIIKVFSKLLSDLSPVITILAKIIGALVKAVQPIIAQLAKALIPILGQLGKIFLVVIKAVMPFVQLLIKALLPILPPLIKLFMVIVNAILPPIIKLLDKVLIPILNFLVGILSKYVIPYWTKLANVLGQILQPVIDFVVTAFQKLMDVLGPIWTNVLKPIIDGIMSILGIKAEPEVTVKTKADTSATDGLAGDFTGGDISGLGSGAGGGAGGGSTTKAQKNPLVQYLKDTQKAITKANADYQKEILKAQDDYQKMIQDKINSFREAFASGTKASITDIFSQGATSASSMIDVLKRKLQSTLDFSKDLGALAAQGYSADFVQEIASAGPQMGDAMAKQLLSATPEQAKQLQSLYKQANDASSNAANDVADSFRSQFASDTKALNDALNKASTALITTLSKIDKGLTKTLGASSSTDLKAVKTDLGATRNQLKTSQVAATTFQTTVNVQTNASPTAIADATVNSIKFGLPVTAGSAPNDGTHL